MFHKSLFEPNLIHNLVWYNLEQIELIKCDHCPTFTVTSSVRKIYKIQKERRIAKQNQLSAIANQIILSDDMIMTFTRECETVFASISNRRFIALLIIGFEITEHLFDQHDLLKVEAIIHILQSKIFNFRKHQVNKCCVYIIGVALILYAATLAGLG